MIHSLLRQSYDKWELVVVDNNSTDSSLEILQKWQLVDSRIIVIAHKNLVSVHDNFSRAFEYVRAKTDSDFVQLLAGDDYLEESTYFETAVLELEKTNSDFVIGTVGEQSSGGKNKKNFNFLNTKMTSRELEAFACSNYWTCNLIYSLFRRSAFLKLSESDRHGFTKNLSSDWWFSLGALLTYKGRYSSDLNYVKHNKGLDYASEHYLAKERKLSSTFLRQLFFPFFQVGDRFGVLGIGKVILFLWRFSKREIVAGLSQFIARKS